MRCAPPAGPAFIAAVIAVASIHYTPSHQEDQHHPPPHLHTHIDFPTPRQVRRPLYSSSVGRWRRYERHLTGLASQLAAEIGAYEAALGASLERLGLAAGRAAGAAARGGEGEDGGGGDAGGADDRPLGSGRDAGGGGSAGGVGRQGQVEGGRGGGGRPRAQVGSSSSDHSEL